ncbi:hypothetical protein [Desulforhopalus sp. 52FAK]
MNGVRTGALRRVTAGVCICLFIVAGQHSNVRAADSCVACHTDEEMLVKSLGKDDMAKSSLQAGPG